jgi:nicotinamidase-related amidase
LRKLPKFRSVEAIRLGKTENSEFFGLQGAFFYAKSREGHGNYQSQTRRFCAIRSEFEPQPGDIVVLEHWCPSGLANTDLDLQLKAHGIHKLIVIGFRANTCVESTVRFAAELGYEVTMVKDATASLSDEETHAALAINIPNYAGAIVPTTEIVDSISSL